MTALLPRLACPDPREAVRFGEAALSYHELAAACGGHAAMLRREGLRPGDRVGVWTQPALETVIALVGNALFGAVSVPLGPKLGERELGHILADAAPRLLLAADPAPVRQRTPSLPLRPVRVDTSGPAPAERAADEAPLLVLYTSGTTGAPKGAVLSARNVASNLDALAEAWRWGAEDTVVHALPLFHVHGLVLGLFGSLRAGGRLHWLGRFSPEATAAALADGGTMLFAVPTMYHRLADAAEREGDVASALGGARLLVSGSAPLPMREHRRIEQATGRGVYERYGLTETLIDCAVRCEGAPRPGYVGPPLGGIELRLVDDARRPLERWDDATIGEVAVRGPNVFAGYLHREDATAAVLDAQGWFYTGDLATRAPDGSVRIVGRKATDLIKTGGYKVGAGEVETSLLEHPAVREAAVVGVRDDDLGERIVAFVVARDGQRPPAHQELVDHVAAELSPHKRPREICFVDALPRNAMGKVIKPELVRRFA